MTAVFFLSWSVNSDRKLSWAPGRTEPEYYHQLLDMFLSKSEPSTCEIVFSPFLLIKKISPAILFSLTSSKSSLFIKWFPYTDKHPLISPIIRKKKKSSRFYILLQSLYLHFPLQQNFLEFLSLLPVFHILCSFCIHYSQPFVSTSLLKCSS